MDPIVTRSAIRIDLQRLADRRFLVAVIALLVNDHVLKQAWPCWLTGKLSDAAGLFAFGWCGVTLLPAWPRLALLAVAVFFTWWKSPLSQPAIDTWNGLRLWTIGRVVDPGDLLAVAVLPMVLLPRSTPRAAWNRWSLTALGLGAIMAFGATTMRKTFMPETIDTLYYEGKGYTLRTDVPGFWQALSSCPAMLTLDTIPTPGSPGGPDWHCVNNVRLREVNARSVRFTLSKRGGKVRFRLMQIEIDHPIRVFTIDEIDAYRDLYRRLFEQTVLRHVDPLAVPHRTTYRAPFPIS